MSVIERIESLRQDRKVERQAQLHEQKAEEIRQSRISEQQRELRLEAFEKFMARLGVKEMFEEIVQAEHLEDAQINTFLGTDSANAFLQLKWPGKKGFREEYLPGVSVPPELGHYRVDARYNFEKKAISIWGNQQNFVHDANLYGYELTNILSGIKRDEVMEAIAMAYLDPKWESVTHIQLAEEDDNRIPF